MQRLQPITKENAGPETAELLEGVAKKLGRVPNIIATMANSTALATAYLEFSKALGKGSLSRRLQEQIALAVGEANNCDYCLAAHTMLGKHAGLTEEETIEARTGNATDEKEQVAIRFASTLTANNGHVGDSELQKLRDVGFTDGEIAEIIGFVSLNIFTNYFNHVAQTEIDFPAAPSLSAA